MKKIALALILAGIASTSFAADSSDWFVGPRISTLGAGVDLGRQFNNNFALRANINGFSYRHSFTADNVNYDGNLHLFTAGLLGDYHPFGNGFRLTAGLYYNDNHINADGHYNGTANIGGTIIDPNQYGQIKAKAEFNKLSPYLGFGYQSVKAKGLSFTADVGVMYQGDAKLSYNASCYNPGNAICAAALPVLQGDIEREKQSLQEKVNNYKWYPVVSVGLAYKF